MFKLDINLDDEQEATEFRGKYASVNTGAEIAADLGLVGEGAAELGRSLYGYAFYKTRAIETRFQGRIALAIENENLCDSIYRNQIQPFCECW